MELVGWAFGFVLLGHAGRTVMEIRTSSPVTNLSLPAVVLNSSAPRELMPDIYYIILDGHGRADVLAMLYNVDNSTFTNGLEQRGFKVASQSRSNYMRTIQSLSSSLNMSYLDSWSMAMGDRQRGGQWRHRFESQP
jgi:hypothetical protein